MRLRCAGLPPSRRWRFAACSPAPVCRRSVFAAVGSLRALAPASKPRHRLPVSRRHAFARPSAAGVCPSLLRRTGRLPLPGGRSAATHTAKKPSFPLILLETTQTFFRGMPRHAISRPCRLRPHPPPVCPPLGPPAAVCPAVPRPAVKSTSFRKKYEFSTRFRHIYQQCLNYFQKSVDK